MNTRKKAPSSEKSSTPCRRPSMKKNTITDTHTEVGLQLPKQGLKNARIGHGNADTVTSTDAKAPEAARANRSGVKPPLAECHPLERACALERSFRSGSAHPGYPAPNTTDGSRAPSPTSDPAPPKAPPSAADTARSAPLAGGAPPLPGGAGRDPARWVLPRSS